MIKVEVKKDGDAAEFFVSGELELTNCGDLKKETLKNLSSCKEVRFNLKDLKYTDSSGIATFVNLLQMLTKKKIKMKITNVPKNIFDIFNLVRLTELFDIEKL